MKREHELDHWHVRRENAPELWPPRRVADVDVVKPPDGRASGSDRMHLHGSKRPGGRALTDDTSIAAE